MLSVYVESRTKNCSFYWLETENACKIHQRGFCNDWYKMKSSSAIKVTTSDLSDEVWETYYIVWQQFKIIMLVCHQPSIDINQYNVAKVCPADFLQTLTQQSQTCTMTKLHGLTPHKRTSTTVLQHSYKTTPSLQLEDFVGAIFYCSHGLAGGKCNYCFLIREKTFAFHRQWHLHSLCTCTRCVYNVHQICASNLSRESVQVSKHLHIICQSVSCEQPWEPQQQLCSTRLWSTQSSQPHITSVNVGLPLPQFFFLHLF